MKIKYSIFVILLLLSIAISAQNTDQKDYPYTEFNLLLGFNIGATAPLPLPEEVREINSYNPKFNPQLGFNFIYNLNSKWGIGSGATFDWRGMRVKDEVKYMYTSITQNGGETYLTGYFVGKNTTNVNMTQITVPVYAIYSFNEKWRIKLGIYGSRIFSNRFKGTVSDGYIRIETPTGTKQEIDYATFDFGKHTRDYDFGFMLGSNYSLNERVGFYADLTWGVLPYFYTDENPIKFKMHNIYGSLGVTYRLR